MAYYSGKNRGKGFHKGMQNGAQFPRITVHALAAGEDIMAFHLYSQDSQGGYFMVQQGTSGMLHPSVGKTDGWTTARVVENWDIGQYNPHSCETWVKVMWTYPLWYNRRGFKLDVSRPKTVTQHITPEQIRRVSEHSEAYDKPQLTLFHLRWGGEQPVNPVTEGAGGWGQIGATPSDNYINGLTNHVFNTLGPTYEIISAFIQNSSELSKVAAPYVRHMMKGSHIGAMYFVWPISYQDGHEYPAYVDRVELFNLMSQMEGAAIPTRFPHQSHLYRVFASKEWTAQMCLHPLLRVPLTTQVSRQAIAHCPSKAADLAMNALQNLAKARSNWNGQLGVAPEHEHTGPVIRGVAKLGWSWEAMDVTAWTNHQQLSHALSSLGTQPGSNTDSVFVQEYVDFDVEMRHFVVEPDLNDPQSLRPKKIVYTVFKSKDQGSFRDFDRYERAGCLNICFKHDHAALAHAEQQAEELIVRWLEWLSGITHELPPVVRFDIMAKRVSPGRARIMTGELTELGGCFLGWPEGPQVVFSAMVRSCMKDAPNQFTTLQW